MGWQCLPPVAGCLADTKAGQLQVGVHGLIINFSDPSTLQPRTATFLPEVRQCQAPG